MSTAFRRSRRALGGGLAAILLGLPGIAAKAEGLSPAPASDGALCVSAIGTAEQGTRLPAKLLGAIAMVESGRADPVTGRATPWPWTINVAGTGHFYASKPEAVAAVEAARAAGIRSIDVGCMQVNLLHHPAAFASLDQAFDPGANAAYAALFLTRLFQQTGTWPAATAAYHSSTPGVGDDYARRVAGQGPLGRGFGVLPLRTSQGPSAVASVDPGNVYTPEFRARLVQDAADRTARLAEMRMPVARASNGRAGGRVPFTRLAAAAARDGAGRSGASTW